MFLSSCGFASRSKWEDINSTLAYLSCLASKSIKLSLGSSSDESFLLAFSQPRVATWRRCFMCETWCEKWEHKTLLGKEIESRTNRQTNLIHLPSPPSLFIDVSLRTISGYNFGCFIANWNLKIRNELKYCELRGFGGPRNVNWKFARLRRHSMKHFNCCQACYVFVSIPIRRISYTARETSSRFPLTNVRALNWLTIIHWWNFG